ncbi:zinc finger CCCH domain-containing protein 66 [Senna tora]|uniref:Zinc finger CCCH domain-containing protein 66 n=1 Tax=Senna tora TaxID=362788 RepID=A0A834WAG9_9FABA|nr:zinc finger CCCH domain-containing protein 66 [Senna tora]
MCSGSKRKPSQSGFAMEGGEYGKQERQLHHRISLLLELSASDDLGLLKDAVEQEGLDVDEVGLWYGKRIGSKKFSYEERTPLMIAAMFGSKGVVSYLLGTGRVDVNRSCGSDGATALHCAVAGGSASSPEVVKLLLDACADGSAIDANGNRPFDLIPSVANSISNSRKRMLEATLKGTKLIDEVCFSFDESVSLMEGQQKKDYPVDLSLPDIKSGIYGTDEFRMYTFKVKPCSRAYSHDWTECPFVHPGENARRRDPRKYNYTCVPCPEFRKGSCSKGDACEYAHGIFESWLHPAQYRTRLCKDEGGCTRRVCFFAHKLEELRPLYASTGSAIPSPRSFSASSCSLDMGPLSPLSLGSPSVMPPPTSTPPLTPSGASSPMGGAMWPSGGGVPTLQMPRSRLKTASSARDIDLDIDLIGLENHLRMQQLMMDEMSGFSSPSGWKNPMPNSPSFAVSLGDQAREPNRLVGVKPTNLEDIFGSHDPSILPQLQSPTGIRACQNANLHLRSYCSSLSNSNVMGSPSRNDPSGAAASTMALNPRLAAFSKRSQSFIERSVVNRHPELSSPVSAATKPCAFSNWGSPDGKLDWTIHGEELNKLRKSASFGFRSGSNNTRMPENVDEPDVSWVHSIVKDPPAESGQFIFEEQQQKKIQCHPNNGSDVVSAWMEQFNMEQEQMSVGNFSKKFPIVFSQRHFIEHLPALFLLLAQNLPRRHLFSPIFLQFPSLLQFRETHFSHPSSGFKLLASFKAEHQEFIGLQHEKTRNLPKRQGGSHPPMNPLHPIAFPEAFRGIHGSASRERAGG